MGRKRPHHGGRRRGTHPRPRKARALLEGTLRILRPGLAYVDTSEGTFAVARRGVREAMNGDVVQVGLVPMHGRGSERVAYVQGVISRACRSVVGTYEFADPLGVVVPLDGRITHDFFVLPEDRSAQTLGVRSGDVVSARILEYPTRQSGGVITVERRLGAAEELDVDIEGVIASYGISTEFPPAAQEEVASLRVDVEKALAGDSLRRDLRGELCFTVDPADARDFDDAVGAIRLDDGGYCVSVHIADVTHYVKWSSSVDLEARHRTCSVYLVDRVVPMLPEVLCNDVCSLRPHEDRLAVTVRLYINRRGDVVRAEAFPSAICSCARLTYDEVDALLAHTAGADELPCDTCDREGVEEAIGLLDEVARMRMGLRRQRGSIDFVTVESKVILDEAGRPVDVVVRRRTPATSLVEEAMLMANESVARMLADEDVATAYRVHEKPAPEDLQGCVPVLMELGAVHGETAHNLVAGDPHAIQGALDAVEGTGAAPLVNALLLRAQKRAIYLPHNDGHYALGAPAYCHFTSPIRRYPDVLVHRALKGLLARSGMTREAAQTKKELPQLCRTCSERERVADAAARASQHIKMAELYGGRVGEKFSGVVVGCERSGLFVMLDDTCAEGYLPVRSLGTEWFVYDEKRMTLTGESTGRVWHIGKRVAVEVAEVDIPRGRITFSSANPSVQI